jgi:hypothetical protein
MWGSQLGGRPIVPAATLPDLSTIGSAHPRAMVTSALASG